MKIGFYLPAILSTTLNLLCTGSATSTERDSKISPYHDDHFAATAAAAGPADDQISGFVNTGGSAQVHFQQQNNGESSPDPVPLATREHWMRRARSALLELRGTPCPFEAFGTAIVNHTGRAKDELGELVCIGVNGIEQVGNPSLHGEIAAMANCTTVLAGPPYNLSPAEIVSAWQTLSLYTTAEACTMCSSAIGLSRFAEYVYATELQTLIDYGWSLTPISSTSMLRRNPLAKNIRIVDRVLAKEMDDLFAWQSNKGAKCPPGCARKDGTGACAVIHPKV